MEALHACTAGPFSGTVPTDDEGSSRISDGYGIRTKLKHSGEGSEKTRNGRTSMLYNVQRHRMSVGLQ